MSRNFVRLVGRVQSYKEITVGATKLGKLTIRQSGRKLDNGEFGPGNFFDVDVWGVSEQLSGRLNRWIKNSDVQVVGRLEQQTWEKDGKKRSKVMVKCDAKDVAFFPRDERFKNDTPVPQKKKEYIEPPKQTPAVDDDIPF